MNTVVDTLNFWGSRFTGLAVPALVQSSILIALLLALDTLLRKRVRATIRHGLWLLVLVKLVLPPSLISPASVAYWLPAPKAAAPSQASLPVVAPVLAAHEAGSQPAAEPVFIASPVSPVQPGHSLTWPALGLLVWLMGMASLTIWLLWRCAMIRRTLSGSTEAPGALTALLESCRKQMGLRTRVAVRCTTALGSPAICGLFRPVIIFPTPLPHQLGPAELRSVLLHELAHLKRGDLWLRQIQLLLLVFYWYNPLLWLASSIIRRVREEAVDEMVLVEMRDEAPAYPTTLLRVARLLLERPTLGLGLLGILESRSALGQRIRQIVSRPPPRTATLGVRGLLLVGLIGLLALPMAAPRRTSAAQTPATALPTLDPATGLPRGASSPATPVRIDAYGRPLNGPAATNAWIDPATGLPRPITIDPATGRPRNLPSPSATGSINPYTGLPQSASSTSTLTAIDPVTGLPRPITIDPATGRPRHVSSVPAPALIDPVTGLPRSASSRSTPVTIDPDTGLPRRGTAAQPPVLLPPPKYRMPAGYVPPNEFMAGRNLSPEEAQELEAKLVNAPDDLVTRERLIGYYHFARLHSGGVGDPRVTHALWVMEHHPEKYMPFFESISQREDAAAFAQASAIWLKHVEANPNKGDILAHAASYAPLPNGLTAESLLKRALALDPNNPGYLNGLASVYFSQARGPADKDLMEKGLDLMERALAGITNGQNTLYFLRDLTQRAFETGEFKKAQRYARELLAQADRVHAKYPRLSLDFQTETCKAHLILGRAALREGDLAEAKKQLLEAANITPQTSILSVSGPNMTLAKELLEKGEKETVLEFFNRCRQFWIVSQGKVQLDTWSQQVRQGEMPDFGPNLLF